MLSEQNCSVKVFKIEHPAYTHALKISHGAWRRGVLLLTGGCAISSYGKSAARALALARFYRRGNGAARFVEQKSAPAFVILPSALPRQAPRHGGGGHQRGGCGRSAMSWRATREGPLDAVCTACLCRRGRFDRGWRVGAVLRSPCSSHGRRAVGAGRPQRHRHRPGIGQRDIQRYRRPWWASPRTIRPDRRFVYPAVYPGAIFTPEKLQKCLRHRNNCKKCPTYPRKQTLRSAITMSAFGSKADITAARGDNHDACPFRTRPQAVVSPADDRLPCRLNRNPWPSLPS
jgi:hypothetical protein